MRKTKVQLAAKARSDKVRRGWETRRREAVKAGIIAAARAKAEAKDEAVADTESPIEAARRLGVAAGKASAEQEHDRERLLEFVAVAKHYEGMAPAGMISVAMSVRKLLLVAECVRASIKRADAAREAEVQRWVWNNLAGWNSADVTPELAEREKRIAEAKAPVGRSP